MKSSTVRGVSLVDVVALVALILVGTALAAPTLSRLRNGCKLTLCQQNLDDIGTSCKIYANDNNERWPTPPFSESAYDDGGPGIDYLAGSRINDVPIEPGEVGFERTSETMSDTNRYAELGSTVVSTTRGLWLLVRNGDVYPEDFVCPMSRDVGLIEYDVEQYYDFASYRNISYGYQVPFGPRDTAPREGSGDRRMVFLADKSPYYLDTFTPTFHTRRGEPLVPESPQWRWRRYNSPNHWGGGQNVGYSDGSVDFATTPLAGVQGDNIYTLMTDAWDESPFNRFHGESPHYATIGINPFPGEGAFGPELWAYSSTDSLLYP